eukprot:5783_1
MATAATDVRSKRSRKRSVDDANLDDKVDKIEEQPLKKSKANDGIAQEPAKLPEKVSEESKEEQKKEEASEVVSKSDEKEEKKDDKSDDESDDKPAEKEDKKEEPKQNGVVKDKKDKDESLDK